MGRLFAGLVAIGLLAAPAFACINDNELLNHEREFRSQYRRSSSPMPLASNSPVNAWVLVAGGATLLTGAAALAFVGNRSRK